MFKVGDKVRVKNTCCEGVITALGDGFSRVNFGIGDYYYSNAFLERMDDMDISERISEVIKENQEFKQKLGEQNIKLNKIQADLKRELNDKGVSDEEFKEAITFFNKNSYQICREVWGGECIHGLAYLFNGLSLSEFVNKYKQYKDKQDREIKVGDEIVGGFAHVVVTYVNGNGWDGIDRNGQGFTCMESFKGWSKTGRHFDEIDTIISALRGSD